MIFIDGLRIYKVYVYIRKREIHRRKDHEGREGENGYSSTLSLTSLLDRVGCQRHGRAVLTPEKQGTLCIEGWVAPRFGLDGCRKSRKNGIRYPDRPDRNESLYRLSNPGPRIFVYSTNNPPFILAPCAESRNYSITAIM